MASFLSSLELTLLAITSKAMFDELKDAGRRSFAVLVPLAAGLDPEEYGSEVLTFVLDQLVPPSFDFAPDAISTFNLTQALCAAIRIGSEANYLQIVQLWESRTNSLPDEIKLLKKAGKYLRHDMMPLLRATVRSTIGFSHCMYCCGVAKRGNWLELEPILRELMTETVDDLDESEYKSLIIESAAKKGHLEVSILVFTPNLMCFRFFRISVMKRLRRRWQRVLFWRSYYLEATLI